MASVTICSNFEAQNNKVSLFPLFSIYLPCDVTGCHHLCHLSHNHGLFQWVDSLHITWPKYWSVYYVLWHNKLLQNFMAYIMCYLTFCIHENSRSSLVGSYALGSLPGCKNFWKGLQLSLDWTEASSTSKLSLIAVGMPRALKIVLLRASGPCWLLSRGHNHVLVRWTSHEATQYMSTYFIWLSKWKDPKKEYQSARWKSQFLQPHLGSDFPSHLPYSLH